MTNLDISNATCSQSNIFNRRQSSSRSQTRELYTSNLHNNKSKQEVLPISGSLMGLYVVIKEHPMEKHNIKLSENKITSINHLKRTKMNNKKNVGYLNDPYRSGLQST